MIYKIFSVFDSKAEGYLQPFMLSSKGEALRGFINLANKPEHDFHIHAEDFTLFELGSFDDQTAKFELEKTPLSLGNALEFKKA